MILKIKEIRLTEVKLYQEDTCIYTGMVEDMPSEYLEVDIKDLNFDSGDLIIKI